MSLKTKCRRGHYVADVIHDRHGKGFVFTIYIAGQSKTEILTQLEKMLRDDAFEKFKDFNLNADVPYDFDWRGFGHEKNNSKQILEKS